MVDQTNVIRTAGGIGDDLLGAITGESQDITSTVAANLTESSSRSAKKPDSSFLIILVVILAFVFFVK